MPLSTHTIDEPAVTLSVMRLVQEVLADYSSGSLSLKAHPVSLVRPTLDSPRVVTAAKLGTLQRGWEGQAPRLLRRVEPLRGRRLSETQDERWVHSRSTHNSPRAGLLTAVSSRVRGHARQYAGSERP